jgi:hypothetical protein
MRLWVQHSALEKKIDSEYEIKTMSSKHPIEKMFHEDSNFSGLRANTSVIS